MKHVKQQYEFRGNCVGNLYKDTNNSNKQTTGFITSNNKRKKGGDNMAKSGKSTTCRSAITGRYVTPKYADTHKKTTVTEHRK